MKKMIMVACLLAASYAHADSIDDSILSGIKAHQAAKCMAYLEVAGEDKQDAYGKLSTVFNDNIGKYVDNALSKDFNAKAISSTIPMTWSILVERNRLDKQLLMGRLLQWTTMVETQRVGNIYAPNERTIPESAGVAAYNQENCILLAQ
ncbi:hypothetical protein [Scandinavium goeteborgense]|uniref:hypothetical protein n=1 Tax=Scandinavium goeteborgense TaxID=1851514 RepID=UPI0015746B7B|nr:hypothetical protein [Scandinavium goeteborgense]QKN82149.1 hypothetical protein A8O29_012955 [Scandinavium goeteborgense]